MVNEDFEAQLSAVAANASMSDQAKDTVERLILEPYADWLEGRGRADMAQAMRAHRPQAFRPVSLFVTEPPDEPSEPGRYAGQFPDVTLPLELFVIDELIPREDPRPIEDRREFPLSRENFAKQMAEAKLVIALDLEGAGLGQGNVDVHVRGLRDLEPSALGSQLSERGIAPDAMDRALAALFSDSRFRTVERTWRSLRWLLDRVSDPVRIAIVNGSPDDLQVDFEDSSDTERSGLFRQVNNHNHPGMRPSGAIVFGPTLAPGAGRHNLLRAMGEVARRKALPLIAALDIDPADPRDWLAMTKPIGRHVTLAGPSFVLRPPHSFEAAPLDGSASYLVAARMAAAFSMHWGGGGVAGELPGVALTRPTSRSRSIFGASRGIVELLDRGRGAELVDAVTASPGAAGSRSLDLHLIACRLGLQLQNLHFRRIWRRGEDDDAQRLAAVLEAGLRSRLSNARDLRVSLEDARFERRPAGDTAGVLDVALSLELPTKGGGSTRQIERVAVRLGF